MAVKHDVIAMRKQVVRDNMSNAEKTTTGKRYPNLGLTRRDSEPFVVDKALQKPGTAGPAIRRHQHRYRSPDIHASRHVSSHFGLQRSESLGAGGGRPKSCFGQRELKPPHHPQYAASLSVDLSSHFHLRGTPDNITNVTAKKVAENVNSQVRPRNNRFSTLAHRGPSENLEQPPRYCVISSAGISRSRDGVNASAARHRKEALSQRAASNSYVITADTASLLVQSKSAPIFRSVSDVGAAGSKRKSAIQEAYYGNKESIGIDIDVVKDTNSGDTKDNERGTVKSKSAHARSTYNSKSSSGGVQSGPRTSQNYHYAFLEIPTSAEASSHVATSSENPWRHENQRLRAGHSAADYAPSENDSHGSHLSSALVTSQGVVQDDSLSAGTHYGFKVDDTNLQHSKLMQNPSNLPLIYPNAANAFAISTNGSSSTKSNKWTNGSVAVKVKSKTALMNPKGKTLTPSKHGYHLRSHSPTFKRLVAVVERLEDSYSREGSTMSPTVSKNAQDPDSDASSDSLRRLRYYRDYLNGFDHSDYTSDESTARKFPGRGMKSVPRNEHDESSEGLRKSRNKTSNDRIPKHSLRTRDEEKAVKNPKERMSPERLVSKETAVETADDHFNTEKDENCMVEQEKMLAFNGTSNLEVPIPKEPERRVLNGQPTQLHFFLPQLADNMSEASGGTLTGRSYYQEQRIDLLNRNELLQHPFSEETFTNAQPSYSHFSRSRDNKPHNACNPNSIATNGKQPPGVASDKFGKPPGIVGGKLQKTLTTQNSSVVNGYAERGQPGQSRETRTSSQSPGRDDPTRSRRYVSPLRSKNPSWDKPGRRKPPGYKLVPYENVYLESQLPSEKLKKQIDNFPTLVSMDFSGSTTPSQSR